MLPDWQKEVNLQWIGQVKTTLKDGGVWIWPAMGFLYKMKDGELVGETEKADKALQAILPDTN